jgi:hypothetical protein
MKGVTVALPAEHWNVVATGLGELPLKTRRTVYAAIEKRVQAQMQETPLAEEKAGETSVET